MISKMEINYAIFFPVMIVLVFQVEIGKRIYRMTRPTIHAANTLTSYSEWLCGIDENFDEETYLDAITDIAEDGQWSTVNGQSTFYTIDGIKLNRPQRGINIVRTTGTDGKVTVKRLLVK